MSDHETDADAGGSAAVDHDALEQHLQALRIARLYGDFVNANGPVSAEIRRAVRDEWSTQIEGPDRSSS